MRASIAFLCIVTVLFACAGCRENKPEAPKTLKVAYIDTDQLLQKWEKYRDLGDQYITQRNEIGEKLQALKRRVGEQKEISKQDKEEFNKLEQKHIELTSQWSDKKKQIVEEIRSVAAEVAEAQKIDVIIDNSESTPVLEYGGSDVTVDILSKLREKEEQKS